MDIKKLIQRNNQRVYESTQLYNRLIQNQIQRDEEESARQRRERDLADEKRRDEEAELDKRLADTLKKEEYRPKPFGGEGYDQYKTEQSVKATNNKPVVKLDGPEPPQFLKRQDDYEQAKPSYLTNMLKRQPSFTPTGKTSVADTGKIDDSTKFTIFNPNGIEKTELDLSSTGTMIDGIESALSIAKYDELESAQNNVKDAMLEKGDPEHANFWGRMLTEAGKLFENISIAGNRPAITYDPFIAKSQVQQKSNWSKDALGQGAILKNESEIKSDVGEINRYKELMRRGADLQRYTSNINRIIDLSDKLVQLNKLQKTKDVQDLINQTSQEIKKLQVENQNTQKIVSDASSYFGNTDEAAMYSGTGWAPQGKKDAKYNLEALDAIIAKHGYNNLPLEIKSQIKQYSQNIDGAVGQIREEFDKKRPELLNRMADNIRELKSWKSSGYNPSEEFKKKADAVTEFNFTDPDTYIYGMPGLIGSSMSFGGYQLASTAVSLAAMAAATAGTGGAAGLAAAGLASTGLGVIGGHYENDTEVGDNYQQLFIDRLNKAGEYERWQKEGRKALGKKDATDDELMYAMAAGIYEPKEKIKDIAEVATYGLNNLYKNDMTAVIGSEIFEAGLNFLGPVTKLAKASMITPGAKASRFKRMYNFMHEHPTAGKVLMATKNFAKDFAESDLGGAVASSVAFPLVLAGKAVQAGLKTVGRALPKSAVRGITKRLGFAADIIEQMPKKLLGAKAIGKNVVDFASKVFGAGWSEAIEEGKQYLNGKQYADGAYSGESDTLMDSIINDIAGGSRAAYSFVGDMFGATSDKELIANMKGGFLGGFGHTATIQGFNAITGAYQDLKASNFVVNNVLAHKMADRTTIANNSYLATQTSPTQYERIMKAFDAMENVATTAEQRNGGTDGLNFTAEDVQEQRKAYQDVFDTANSKNVQDGAKQLDIKPGTKKFGNYVGLIMWAKDLAKQGITGLNELEKSANSLVNGLVSGNQEESRGIQEILGTMTYGDLLKINDEFDLIDTEVQHEGDGAIKGGLGGETLYNMQGIRAAIPNLVSYIKEIASLDALFTLRDQLEMTAEPTTADKRRLRSVNRQIKRLQSLSRFKAIKNASTVDDFKTIPNQKLHDVLRDLYRDSANYITDIEEATAIQYLLLGGKVSGMEFLTSPEMQEAYKNAQTDFTDRKKSALDLIDKYLASVKSDEELRQQIHDTFEATTSEEEQSVEDMETETQPVEEAAPESSESSSEQPSPEPVETPTEPEPSTPGTTVQEPAENASEATETAATSTSEPQIQEPEGEVKEETPQVEDYEDYDEQVAQIEAEYSPSSNTIFTSNDVNTDFETAKEDWDKVTDATKQLVDNFMSRWNRFTSKWNGKVLSKQQYAGVNGAAIRFQNEFDALKERVKRDIQQFEDQQNQTVPEHLNPTDDQLWENLHSRELFEKELYEDFEKWVLELQMRWDHFISAKTDTNARLYSEALSNVQMLLNAAEDNDVQLNLGSLDNYIRVKGDIDEYNKLYENIQEPPTVPPTIEAPSVRYERPWAQYTTTHTGMEASRGYNIEDSVATDGSGVRLSDVSANPDFLENGVFWFTTRTSTRTPKIQLNVMYGGHQFSPIDIHTSDSTNGKGKLFYSQVLRMLGEAGGRLVMPQKSAISRSNGIIEGNTLRTFEQMGLFADDTMYDIEFSSSQDTFCIVQYRQDGTPIAYVPGQAGGHHEVYEYSRTRPDKIMPADGGMVMMVHPPYPEIDKDQKVPVNVHYSPVTEGDAQLIIDLLSGKYMADNGDYGAHAMENQVFFEDGIYKGLTRMQVLRMLIRYKALDERYNPYQQSLRYIEYDKNDQRYVILHGNFGEGVEIPNNGRFNILDEQDQKTLKDFLLAHHNKTFTYNEFLECRVNKGNDNFSHPLHGLTEFKESEMGKEVFRNGGKLTFGQSTIVFDEKDFGDFEHPEGLSGLAWAMRRGFVQTKFTGFTNPLLNFNEDIPLVFDDTPQQPEQPAKNPAVDLVDDIPTTDDLGIDDSLEDMDLMTGQKAKDKFSVEKANEFLSKVLGEEITDKNVTDKLAEISRTNASVLGLCHFSGKMLFDPYAPQGTVYHEAFHKIVELLLGDKTRKMLYKAYARKMHIKYKDDADLLSNKQIREGLAEEFRYYMENRPTFNLGAIRNPFKFISQVAKIMGKIGDFRLYTFYVMTRMGATKHLWSQNAEKVQRFLQSHGAFAPFSIGGHEFKHILNRYQYRVLRNTLVYLVFRTNDVSITGEGLENLRISKAAIERDQNYQRMINSRAHGALALQELVENIDVVENDLRTYLANTFEINRNEDDEAENVQDIESGEGVLEASFDQLKYSHESSQFSRTGAKVKFILARIPKKRFGYKAGKRVTKNILNDEGLVEYFDVKYVFNTLVNQCHDCRNSKELLNRLAKLGKDNAMFDYIHRNVVQVLYDKAQQGDADAEASFSQLLVALHAAKGEYVIGKANRSQDGTWNVTIQNTDSDYNAKEYKIVWSQLFANGSEYLEKTTSGYQMKFRKGTDRRYSPEVFQHIYDFFTDVKKAVSSGGTVTVNFKGEDGKVRATQLDVTKEDQFDYVKDEFCNTLQKLGIQFSKDELNYTLRLKYGSSDHTALMKMFESTGPSSITPFLDWLRGCYNKVTKSLNITPNGTLNGKSIDTALASFGFIGMLANAKYKYTHDHDQLSVLATKGNRYYVISENSLITDVTDDINASLTGDEGPINDLKSFSYNYMEQGSRKIGSIVIKQVEDGSKLKVVTVAGFRTDQKGDMGQDYAEISPAEDYITKCQILTQEGGLIFPTMSDKKTWTYLTGITIPGLTHINTFTDLGNGKYTMSQDRQVLEQLLQYALCEKKAVEECIKQVRGYTDEEGTKHPPLDDSQKVMNYHKGNEYDGHTIVQGGRFGVLTGIYDENGNWVSFNRVHEEGSTKYKDEIANWKTAQAYFFGIPDPDKPGMYYLKTKKGDSNWSSLIHVNEQQLKEHQFKLLTRSLNKQVENELKYAEDLGLIKKVSNDEKIPIILRYENKLLDAQQIKLISENYKHISNKQQRESMAIAAFLSRVSAASNISIQEVERLYAGHPAFFKWKYGSNGELIDRSIDQHKRLGGLISTGQNNVLDIPGIPTKYTCAEVDNEMIGSALQDDLSKMIEDGELRSAYMRSQLDKAGITFANSNSEEAKQLSQKIENMSIDEIKQALQNENADIYDMLTKNAKKKSSDFMSDIDVADGAAYVTDEMAEWLLRMVGSWDSKIERAFKILRGQEVDGKVYTTKDILTLQKAYQDVLTTVIGNQKYTAYGFRFANGIAAPYYDKMAIFPMFKCISTGATAKIFDKMKKEGVHMLMINSAVKVGSQGSKPMVMSEFKEDYDPTNENNFIDGDVGNQNWKPQPPFSQFTFNKYEQDFKYIRKQFNTDPHGSLTNKMGTQMTKVVMASIIPGRDYTILESVDENGNRTFRTASALDVRNDIMNCINQISNIGEQKVRERFIKETKTTGENGEEITTKEIKIEELSKFLKEELASRGASQEAIDAVSITLDANGEPAMYIPPVAQNSLEWIQSIVTSMINKNVIDINTPGAAFIQRSAWAMEGATTVQNEEDLPASIYEGRELQMINEEGSMDCVLSIDFFDDIIPDDVVRDDEGHIVYEMDDQGQYLYTTTTDENGSEIRKRVPKKRKKSFEDAKQWLIENGIISGRKKNGEWSNATANVVGSRIPTQAQSSIHALRCVDVLPVVRDTIVLPKEFTKITGADFDIDKLFLSRFYYDVKNGKANTSFKEGSHEYYANRLLSDYIALLKDSKSENEQNVNRTAHSNHASIDGDTKLLKDIIKDIEEGQAEKPLDPFTPYSLWANASTKTEFITGKFGIGPFALNNNSHILTMLYGVKFKQDGFLGQLGMYRLDQSSDRYGNSILSWISGLINAHVDVAKDPYIARLNVNSYTYNLVNLMIRTGFGKDTFYFTTQPIMVEMANAYNNAASQYGSESSRSKSRRQNEAVEEVVYNFVKSNFSLPKNVGTLKQANKVLDGYFEKVRGISVDDAIQILLSKNNDILHQISKKHIPMNGHARMYKVQDNVNLSAAEIQYLVYRAKDKFQPYEQQLSDLVKYSKIDTRKQGKNVTEQMAYREGVDRLFNLPGNDYGLFEDLSDYYNDSYIKDKTNNALDLFMDIMGSFTIESTNQFQVQVDRILNQIGEKNASADMRKAVSKQIMNYIRAGFFNTWAQNMNINIKGLVSGNNTISDRLEDIRIKIMTDPAYSDMRSVDGSIKNYLLASLVQGFQHHEELRYNAYNAGTQPGTYQDVKFVKTLNFMDSDHVNEDDMAEAWDELLNDTLHPEIRMFARDLIMYAYITSGGNSGNNLFKYIPNSWKLNSYDNDTTKDSYAQYMQDQLELYQNSTDELPINVEEIILNNWFDDKFIPTIKADGVFFEAKGYYTGRYYYEGRNAPEVSIPIMLIKENADIEQFSDEEYIKIKRNCSDPHSPRNYTIYKKLSYTTNGKLIYVMVDPKGNKFPHDTVYEMRRSDASIQESTAIAGISAQFTESMMIAKQAMGIQGGSVSDIMTAFLGKLSAANNVGTEMAMINAFTKDPVLAELMKDAAGVHLAEDGVVEIEQPAKNKQEAEEIGARTYEPSVEAQNDNLIFDTSTAEFYSGGAIGSDTEWAIMARQFGIKVKEYTTNDYDSLSDEWKDRLNAEYEQVAAEINRNVLSEDTYAGKLVRRDMMQADKADAVFAIGTYTMVRDYSKPDNTTDPTKSVHSYKPQVNGGTAYAVQRALQRGIPVYFFDQNSNKWLDLITFKSIDTPRLTQHAAVIGTREITDTGKEAIRNVFKETLNYNNTSSIDEVYNLLKSKYPEGSSESKLTDIVFNALRNSDIVFEAATLDEDVSGRFIASENKILYNSNPEYMQTNTLLHEAIHAATSYYLETANRDKLPQEIRIAIEEIEECYRLLKEDFIKQHFYENGQPKVGVDIEAAFSFWTQDNDTYGYTSPAEMVAELGKPSFVEHIKDFDRRHKGENVFQRLISAIAQLFGITKEYKSLEKTIKDALVVLLTNPNKELMDRYAKENDNIKVNHKALNDCNHVNFENRRVIGEIVKELPEDTDDEYFDTVMKLPKDVAEDSLQVPQGAHHPLTQSNKGAVFVFEKSFFFTLNGNVTIDDEFVNVPIRIYSKQGLQNNVFEISNGENGIDYVSKVTPLFEDQKNYKPDINGNYYGWSVQSIYNHLYSYVVESTGYSSKEKLSHVKKVNKLYGTNFRAFRKNGVWQLLNNTNEYNKLKLSEDPNEPKQLELFGSQENQITELANLGKNLRENQCK